MAIPESQLETWAALGSVQQSAGTYESIRAVLNDATSAYYGRNFSIFLQGSYGNNTNVYRDSDVDIVMCLNDTYYSDTAALEAAAKGNYDRAFRLATYGYNEFRADVISWLQRSYSEAAVVAGKKAVFVKGNGSRRDVDILVCAQYRRYRNASNGIDAQYDEGVCFWSEGRQVSNFPKQHAQNCTTKQGITNQWFKPTVRVYKNMRNRMIDDGCIAEGVAPSYFIEGMLWNVPVDRFGTNYQDSFVNTFNWVLGVDKSKLACANDLFWLVRDNAHNCWSTASLQNYLAATRQYWEAWGR